MDEETTPDAFQNEIIKNDAPKLAAVLREMKEGLDVVRTKVQLLTAKVKENNFQTADGISYLEAKHLLLVSYCQSIVYYLLRKAKGLSIDGHPVVRSLVEIRLFLEKVRPIDKKLDYQIGRLVKIAKESEENKVDDVKKPKAPQNSEDLMYYRPNPDMFITKSNKDTQDGDDVYRPPKIAPTAMDDDKISKQEKMARRKDEDRHRKAKQSDYVRELMDDLEGKPEEVREIVGAESREAARYKAKRAVIENQEEDLFTRMPLTKLEKRREKHLMKSRNGLLGLADGFEDDIRTLGFEEEDSAAGFNNVSSRGKKFRGHKRKR